MRVPRPDANTLAQGPVYLAVVGVALWTAPVAGAALAGWIVAVIGATWPRAARRVAFFVADARRTIAGARSRLRRMRRVIGIGRRRGGERRPRVRGRLAGRAPAGPGAVSVVCANLCHDWPRGRRRNQRFEAFARLVEERRADVVLLQEVMRDRVTRADAWLADRLGMTSVYARANGVGRGLGFEEGVAILSRYPVAAPAVWALGGRPGWLVQRLAVAARLESPGGPFWAVSTHLALRPRRNARQLDELRRRVAALDGGRVPVVVGGDLNAEETSPQVLRARRAWCDVFRALHPDAPCATFVVRGPGGGVLIERRLDYLFLAAPGGELVPAEAAHLETPDERHSDHHVVWARLERRGDGDRAIPS